MRVFVAGATGVVGQFLVPSLVAAGHEVTGTTRSTAKAATLQAAGATRMILQRDLSGERLANEIGSLLAAPERISQMEEASRKLARRDAARATVDLMEKLIQNRI